MEKQQKPRGIKTKTGVVVSNKMEKTVTVGVDCLVLEPLVKKYMRRSKKFLAHDANNECDMGDFVQIKETKPISKKKCWTVVKILKKAEGKGVELKEGVDVEDTGTPPPKREKEEEERVLEMEQ